MLTSSLKQRVLPRGTAPRRVHTGTLRGLTLDMDLSHQLQGYVGLAEHELTTPMRRLVSGVHTCIDVGAADGWYTTFFLTAGRGVHVIAVEPDAPHTDTIWRNAVRNAPDAFKRLTIIKACIGSPRPGFDDDGTIPLDALLPVRGPCLVKIDIEGAELDALNSADQLLRLPDVRLIVETHSRELEEACVALLDRYGYRTEIVPNAWWRVIVPETRLLPHNRWLVATKP